MIMYKGLEVLCDALCLVGESPLWIPEKHELAQVDIRGKRLRRIDMNSGRAQDTILDKMTAFISETADGRLIGGAVDGIYIINDDGSMQPVNNTYPIKGQRYNDGKPGPDGKLYMGTFSQDYSAAFYRMDEQGNITELFAGVGNSNGIDWNEKLGTFYYCDTPTKRIDTFDFNPENGSLSNRRTAVSGLPAGADGMAIDSEGNLWAALWGDYSVVCVNPEEKKIIRRIDMPVKQPSCCVFAGDDLRDLIITSAGTGVSIREEPLSGATFRIRVDVPGKEHYRYKLEQQSLSSTSEK